MKIFCIGRNYVDHIHELKNEVPTRPLIFMKPPTALLTDNKPLYYPDFTKDLHYEGEIVLRICKNGKNIRPEFARKYYDQIAFGIDFTARDLQDQCKAKGHPWEIAKGFDGSAALSRFIPLPPHFREGIHFSLRQNGQLVQDGNTNLMIYPFDVLITEVSRFFTLRQGDILYTGTPAGVGPVQIGDVLEGTVENELLLRCEIK